MKTLLPTLLAVLLGSAQHLAAQRNQQRWDDRPASRWNNRPATISGGLEIGIPIGEFDEAWGRQMAGLSANFTMPMRRLPFSYGFDFGWQRMGSRAQEVTVDVEDLGLTTGEMKVRSSIYGYHGLLRLQPLQGKVSPYAELMTGMRHFVTRSEIEARGIDDPVSEERLASEFIGSIGWAAGINYAPTRNFFAELRLERLNGGRVGYVDPRSIVVDQAGNVDYSTLSSGTRVANLTFGVGLRF
ncbi:MAG: hypothetical protein IPK70_00440 [Flavobacteriales bacterium]|nr:hypothetical protein [Flavobacteriales bacterium]